MQANREDYLARARTLLSGREGYHNCAQSVLMPFAADCGISEEKAYELGMYFGSGMHMGGCCGAITGGLMVLGMLGGDERAYQQFMNGMRTKHDGLVNCSDLLRKNQEQGGNQKAHCDQMVYDAIDNLLDALA